MSVTRLVGRLRRIASPGRSPVIWAVVAGAVAAPLAAQPAQFSDTVGRRILTAAIAHKHERRSTVHDYHYGAYVRFIVRDLDQPGDSVASVALITETHSEAYWEPPDHYQETVLARRQFGNVGAERNLVSVGEIVNFNRDRVDLGNYSLVSPIADDALDSYDCRILDTLFRDDPPQRIYRLVIEPRTNASPLFVGIVEIADSSFELVAIDVGVNDVVQFPFITNLRYRQSRRDLGNDHWIPDDIRLTAEVDLRLPVVHLSVPIPGFPRHAAFEQVATLTDFRFGEGHPPSDLREVRVRLDQHADHSDSAVWTGPDAIRSSAAERGAWARADSLRRQPPTVVERVRRGVETARFLINGPDVFHFNRVDGAYFGVDRSWHELPGVILDVKIGRAEASEIGQYRLGGQVRLWRAQRLWLGGWYYDQTTTRSTFGDRMPGDVMRGGGDDLKALLFGIDHQDYYRARGYAITGSTKVLNFTRLDLQYTDESQSSLPVAAYAVLRNRRAVRDNPSIADGKLRSVSAAVTYDSRPVFRGLQSDTRLPQASSTRITLMGELAAPRFIPNAFNFGRYSVQVERRQPMLGLGVTTLTVAGAVTTGQAPPQREFGVNLRLRGTLSDSNIYATHVTLVRLRHDFGRLLFAKSGIPGIRRLPVTVSADGSIFWMQSAEVDSLGSPIASHFYRLRLGLGNLTPFLRPFNFGLRFDWQFFNQQRRFQFGVALGGPP